MLSHALRHLVRSGGFGGSIHILRLGCLSLVLLVATPGLAATLTLTWADVSTNEDGFKIERKAESTGAYGQLATLGAETTAYVDGTVSPGVTYCYRVRAYNNTGDSAYSNEACAAPVGATLYSVAVTKSGTGSGTVASSPTAITCGSACSASIASGTSVALAATPETGSTFAGWSGPCIGTGNCAFVVQANTSLTATFDAPTTPTTSTTPSTPTTCALTVTKNGNGKGTVNSFPDGIACGRDCSESYTAGTSVTLTATPAAGVTFAGWSGVCSGTSTTCTVTLNQSASAIASFKKPRR